MSFMSRSLRSQLPNRRLGPGAACPRPGEPPQPNDGSGPPAPLASLCRAALEVCRTPPAPAALVAALGLGLAALLAAALSALRRVEVRGPSMRPTLEEGDRLLVAGTRRLRVGDLVVLREPGGDGLLVVKRLAALEGAEVVVRGDNPGQSRDSRAYGPVPRAAVVGRAWWRYHPPERAGRLTRG